MTTKTKTEPQEKAKTSKHRRTVVSRLRRWFLSGLLVVVPLLCTWAVLKFLFETVDGIFGPFLVNSKGERIPGLGILASFLIVMIMGIVAAGVIGKRLVKWWEALMARLPIVRMVYSGARQVVEQVGQEKGASFQEVGLIEYPRTGMYALVFLANRIKYGTEEHIAVFVPSTPTPFTGSFVLVKEKDYIPLDMTVEEALKLVVSGGIVSPKQFVVKKD